MSRSLRALLNLVAGIAACVVATPPSFAQTWPTKPIKVVVPYNAGGTADLLARTIGQKLSEKLGQQVVVDNRPGAGGNLGADVVAKAKPDGYTLVMGTVATHAINPTLYPALPFDAQKSFAPIVLVATLPNIVVVHPSLPAKSVKELIALAKSKPDGLAFASAGNGTSQHLAASMFEKQVGVQMTHVVYKGSAPAVADLVSGQVHLMFDNIPISLEQVRAGKLRALAVTGPKRSPALPDLPTLAESGLPGFAVTSWFGLFAPAGTPPAVIERINREVNAALADDKLRNQYLQQGIEPAGGTPQVFASFVADEIGRWAKVVRDSGAKIE
jgi:tripartite-type tricarboxylate transporter receptor subunit TctC